ncbi:cupredoxin domain-containing protein [Colwelliaceae bacterium 6471]
MSKRQMSSLIFFISSFFVAFAVWADKEQYALEIKDHLFYPAEIVIPANKKIKLIIYNRDDTPEEFDSFDLNREKVIFPHKKAVIYIGPLPEGRYEFFGEYNPNSARGALLVTSAEKTKNKATINIAPTVIEAH